MDIKEAIRVFIKRGKAKVRSTLQAFALLKKSHSYALKLTHIFNTHHDRKSAMAKLDRWVIGVEKSDLSCFNTRLSSFLNY